MTFDAPMPPPPASTVNSTPYATWLYRVGGYLVDSIPTAAISWIGLIIDGPKVTTMVDPNTGVIMTQTTGAGGLYWICLLAATAFAIWNVIIRQGKTGQSIGKQLLGIKLIKESTGQPLGPLLTLGRNFLHILDALPCFVGFLWPLWDAKRQTFADKIVSSVVVPVAK